MKFHQVLKFFGLLEDLSIIRIKDSLGVVIDSVKYSAPSFPVGTSNYGKAVEYILNPSDSFAVSLNDIGSNWRSSEYADSSKMFIDNSDISLFQHQFLKFRHER